MTPSMENQGQKEPVQNTSNSEDHVVDASNLEAKYITLLEEKIARLEKEDADRAAARKENAEIAMAIANSNSEEDEDESENGVDYDKDNHDDAKSDMIAATKKEGQGPSGQAKPHRVHYIERKRGFYGGYSSREVDTKPTDPPKNIEASKQEQEEYAVCWRYTKAEAGSLSRERVEGSRELLIESSALKKALKEVIGGYPSVSFDTEEVAIRPPYEVIYHNTSPLKKYAETADDVTKEDIHILLREVEQEQATERKDVETLLKQGEITYALLWTLFYPGCKVLRQNLIDGKQKQISIVAPPSTSSRSDPDVYELLLWNVDFTGKAYEVRSTSIIFSKFPGSKKLDDLGAFPLDKWQELHGEAKDVSVVNDSSEILPLETLTGDEHVNCLKRETLIEEMTKRGRKFEKLCAAKLESRFCTYDGDVMPEGSVEMLPDRPDGTDFTSEPENPSILSGTLGHKGDDGMLKLDKNSFVMVDHEAFYQFGSRQSKVGSESNTSACACKSCQALIKAIIGPLPTQASIREARDRKELLTDVQCMLCPPRVLGFAMRVKLWVQMLVLKVRLIDPITKGKAFESLELDRTNKKLLETLVKEHSRNDSRLVDDLIPGKGNGLIVLLHGPPGVGKTLTAESLAMLCGRPLYSVSMSDVGTSPATVEQNMIKVFELATHWRALLLFDEAEIFLEERSLQDLRRNSLVSILLRILEYFRGILFLTSNRVKTFDEAFQSRIHLAVRYRELTERQRNKIWRMWLKKYEDDVHNVDDFYDALQEGEMLYKAELNGRQIRNVFSSSMALAKESVTRKLTLDHVRQVLEKTVEFQSYMLQNKEMAEKKGIR